MSYDDIMHIGILYLQQINQVTPNTQTQTHTHTHIYIYILIYHFNAFPHSIFKARVL